MGHWTVFCSLLALLHWCTLPLKDEDLAESVDVSPCSGGYVTTFADTLTGLNKET